MKKVKGLRWILYLVSTFITMLVTSVSVYAFDPNKPFNPKDVTTWTQSAWPECHTIRLAGGTGSTISAAACSYFATSYAMVKAGIMDPKTGRAPLDFIEEVNRTGGWDTPWGHFDSSKINDYFDKAECVENGVKLEWAGMTQEEALAVIKKYYNDGYYVMICVVAPGITDGHYVFCDGYDENGDMIVGDSGYCTTRLNGYMNNNLEICYCRVYSVEGAPCNEMQSIYSDKVGQRLDGRNGAMSDDEMALYRGVVDEYDLEGMGKYRNYLTAEDCVVPEFMWKADLSLREQSCVSDIGETIESEKLNTRKIFFMILSFVGICCILYSVLLLLAYFLDYNNSFIDLSLLALISFGRLRVVSSEEVGYDSKRLGYSKKDKCTYLTMGMVAKRAVILFVVGALLVSGALSSMLLEVIWWIVGLFK